MSKVSTTKNTAKSKAKETVDAVKDHAEDAVQDARSAVKSTAQEAKTRAAEAGKAARTKVADRVDDTADTFSSAAGKMTKGSPQAEATARVATAVSNTADRIRNTDLVTLRDDVTDLARRHPLAFAGAAALLGFAAGRFFKSSAPGNGYGSDYGTYSGRADTGDTFDRSDV